MTAFPLDPITDALAQLRDAGPPLTLAQLNRRTSAIAEVLTVPEARVRQLLGTVIITQMLPPDVTIKGGMGIKLRIGERGTRATRDLDVAAAGHADVAEALAGRLAEGWGTVPASKRELKNDPGAPSRVAFIGEVRAQRRATPPGVPQEYVMSPYRVSLSYISGKNPFVSIPLEIGIDEFDGSRISPPRASISPQIVAALEALGCGEPGPVMLISLAQQIAQKIHAVTDPTEQRGHDLVDLQLLWHEAGRDPAFHLPALRHLCERTFQFRSTSRSMNNVHAWPPAVTDLTRLAVGYETARQEVLATSLAPGADIADDITDAADWLAGIVSVIAASPLDEPRTGGDENP